MPKIAIIKDDIITSNVQNRHMMQAVSVEDPWPSKAVFHRNIGLGSKPKLQQIIGKIRINNIKLHTDLLKRV